MNLVFGTAEMALAIALLFGIFWLLYLLFSRDHTPGWLVVTLAVLLGLLLYWHAFYPIYAWNQKIFVTIATPYGPVHGASVMEVVWRTRLAIFPEVPRYTSEVHGEAVVVDLGGGRYLISLLRGIEQLAERVGISPLKWPDEDGFNQQLRGVEGKSLRVPYQAYPSFIYLKNIDEPEMAVLINPMEMSSVVGEGYNIADIFLTVTREEKTEGLTEEILPCLDRVDRCFSLSSRMHKSDVRRH